MRRAPVPTGVVRIRLRLPINRCQNVALLVFFHTVFLVFRAYGLLVLRRKEAARAMRILPLILFGLLSSGLIAARPADARELVGFNGYAAGTIVVKTNKRRLYYVVDDGRAIRDPVGAGLACGGRASHSSTVNTSSLPGRRPIRSSAKILEFRASFRPEVRTIRWVLRR